MKNAKGLVPDQLYWDETGHVACGDHAPLKGSDTWRAGRWQKLPADFNLKAASDPEWAEVGKCEVCGKS